MPLQHTSLIRHQAIPRSGNKVTNSVLYFLYLVGASTLRYWQFVRFRDFVAGALVGGGYDFLDFDHLIPPVRLRTLVALHYLVAATGGEKRPFQHLL
jgi:hypothetical protein